MPGAPNRPPETAAAPPPPPPVAEPPDRKVLRRLAPARVALLLDLWKGAPSAELVQPFDRAEAAFEAKDFPTAVLALDQLSIRFAEPRWPSLPAPFRQLRVAIPTPQPPHWDPDHGLDPAAKEARRAKRVADDQLALAKASVVWAGGHSVEVGDLPRFVDEAGALLPAEGPGAGFYERVDAVWDAVRSRFPRPRAGTTKPAPSADADG